MLILNGRNPIAPHEGSKSALAKSFATRLYLPAFAAALLVSQMTFAESPPAATAQAPDDFEPIVVTARRRDENLERVPSVIVVLSADELQKRAIFSEADLQRSVPGLTIRETQNSNSINYSIRGQTVDDFSSSQPGVLAYVNDVQITSLSASSFFDLQSIQVLKGPQGTLFGRNTTGGAVLFTTAKPGNSFSGNLTARFGNYSRKEVEGYVNVPVINDKLMVRFSGKYAKSDGYEQNLTTGGDVGRADLGGAGSQSGRVSILFRPIDALANETVMQYTHVDTQTAGGVLYSVNPCGSPGLNTTADCLYNPTLDAGLFGPYIAANPQAYPGGMTAMLALQQSRGPYSVNYNSPSFFKDDAWSATNTTSFTINPNLLVKNIAGISDSRIHFSTDADGSPYTLFNYGPFGKTIGQYTEDKQYSEELQLQGKAVNEQLNYIVGVFYGRELLSFYLPQNFFELAPLFILPASNNDFSQVHKSEAVFTQGTYNLQSWTGIEGLSATGGFRYTWETVTSDQTARGSRVGDPELSKTFKDPSWTVGLEYQMTPEVLMYVTHRGSWRSGGFNGFKNATPGLADVGGSEFLPETTKDVELGLKYSGHIAGRPVRLNVAAYNQWITNVQRVLFVPINGNPTSVTASVPSAAVSGFELDGEYNATPWLTIGATAAFTDARFTGNNIVNLFGTVTAFGPYPDTPRWTGSLFADVKLPVPSTLGNVSVRADTYHQGNFFFSSTNGSINPGTEIPSYGITNFRLTWDHIAESKVGAAIFVTNAFDKTYYTGGLAVGSVFGLNTAVPGKPRMFGGEIHVGF